MNTIKLENLTTENSSSLNIDKVSTLDMVKIINNEDKKVALAVEKELVKIAEAIDGIVSGMQKGGRLIYIGAGTSGRLGILDASECPPTYGVSEELVQGIIAGGTEAIFRAKEGVEDSKELAIEDLKSKNITESGLEYANKIGALTVSITCNANSEVAKVSKVSIAPVVGAEVVTGSTRMKAGTAQKLVLNMLSTGTMIKLGKVYGNLMVDVRATNKKLVERAKKIVCEATGVDREVAEKVLKETNYDVKLSILMILTGLDINEAKEKLTQNKGYIAKAMETI